LIQINDPFLELCIIIGITWNYKEQERQMITTKLSDAAVMKNAHNVDARNLYNTADAMITVIKLNSGQALKPHITPVNFAFYVLSGKGIIEIGDEKQEVVADTLVESPKDIMHCWYNESDAPLRFMVVKAPRPTSKTIFIERDK
jgi:mannose-6-phosphate isomerase-like protein (cupin superfamily)